MREDQETISIHTTGDPIEEAEICAALDEAGIRYVIQPFEDYAYDGLFTRALGHSRVSVLESDVERAMEAIQPVVEQFQQGDDKRSSQKP
ncbi:MAG: DUF2007 domain-containing protein [bacterium]